MASTLDSAGLKKAILDELVSNGKFESRELAGKLGCDHDALVGAMR